MQHLNDDMDELFRKAAEGYPLNTKGADWQKMQAMLSQEQAIPVKKKGSRKHFLWLLALLPFAFICNRISNSGPMNQEPAVAEQQKTPAGTGDRPETTTVPFEKKSFAPATRQNSTAASDRREKTREGLSLEHFSSRTTAARETNAAAGKYPEERIASNPGLQAHADEAQYETRTATQHLINTSTFKDNIAAFSMTIPAAPAENKNIIAGAGPTAINQDSAVAKDGPVKTRRFYGGVIAGPDMSTVKFRRFSNVGFQAGIIFGYQVSNRFAIELSALSSKKYYYSEGKYLNTKKLYLPPNSKILSMDGNCRMIELPLALQYAFGTTKTHSWFASAGISSYIMKKENYSYDYLYINSGNVVKHDKTYLNETRNWASVLQLSAGYQARLGEAGDLRIEPYYSIPLKGIGYGELPLSSFGLRLGLVSKHF